MATVSETHLENRERVQPNHTNNYGTAHGGNILRWMDEIGEICAMRAAGETCVTAHVDNLDFKRPVPQGDICVINAYAYATGRSSIRIRVQAFREDPRTGERQRTTDSYFIFVAIDDDGKPVSVPALTVDSERDRELKETALASEPRK